MLGLGHGGLYKQVYSDDTLTEAWRKVRTGTEMAGVDGVTVNLFQARLFANLKALQTELRKGRYAPQPVKRLSIPKSDGSQRPLGILTVRDRIVQRAVLIVVEPLFEAGFEACSHGYRKGRSVQTALTQLCQFINQGYGWIVDFDIAACFETINTNRLCTFVNERLKNPELRRLVRAWLDMEAATVTRAGLRRQRQTVGILQGGTLSPLFANIYLNRMFAAVNVVGLDPYLGFFHQPKHGHAALVSDLIEEWRAVVVDSIVLTVINRREIKPEDFQRSPRGPRLSKATLTRFLTRFDARLNETVSLPGVAGKTTCRRAFELQARQAARAVGGEQSAYEPFRV